jgi:tRNA (guanosine-2'-O-)-methyltransferase
MDWGKLNYLEGFLTEERLGRFREVLANRTRHITVALEDVYHLHNTSAVIRSCDVFGIQDIQLIESRFGKQLDRKIAMGAQKWVDVYRHKSTTTCLEELRNSGYKIVAASPYLHSYTPENLPLDTPIALFLGAEKEGLSVDIMEAADMTVHIPMLGFTESLNVSVAAAILLHQLGQRLRASDLPWRLSEEEQWATRFQWAFKSVRSAADVLSRYKAD